ncbi:MAG: 2-succinyl-5-enolpyruvyl-6-hydroxy-3-cyclohexene-1-carboxylic-acid synthase, partial [Chloroflexota bacterium]|nr:2-succinyl-5-enolpyruvyl-6-hydroxy-3-cyclohexene-1-carboxylic-acid synthase [Chloroflexota bacterium]
LYGAHVRWFTELPVPDGSPDLERYVRVTACRAVAAALDSSAGPVHLNFPFREPLLPDAADMENIMLREGREDGEPMVRTARARRMPEDTLVNRLATELDVSRRGLIVCGPQDDARLAEPLVRLAQRLGYPVLADGLSPLRSGAHDRSLVIDTHDSFLRDAAWCASHEPEVILRFGAIPTSKPLVQYLARFPCARHIVVDEGEGWRDSSLLAAEMVYADPVEICERVEASLREWPDPPVSWAHEWLEAHARAGCAMGETLDGMPEWFEGRVFAELRDLLPDGTTLFVGNSMPVRDLDTFFGATNTSIRTLCNRGANGIDGVVSSALGASVEGTGPLVLAIGDLSFYHDMNGLLAAKLYDLNITILLINNDGGGIFSFLPQAKHREHFEMLYGTPHGLDFSDAVKMYGGEYVRADTMAAFRAALAHGIESLGLTVIEVCTDRERNVRLHREVWAAVSEAIHADVGVRATP